MRKLKSISDIRSFFHGYETPTYFVSATPFNLLGAEEWIRDFTFINYIDCFDGKHPAVFVPSKASHPTFESIEQINNYLLSHRDVERLVKRKAPKGRGPRGNALFLFFDEETERLCERLKLRILDAEQHMEGVLASLPAVDFKPEIADGAAEEEFAQNTAV